MGRRSSGRGGRAGKARAAAKAAPVCVGLYSSQLYLHLGFYDLVLGPAGNRRFWGVWAAPKTIPKGGGLRPPHLLEWFWGHPGPPKPKKSTIPGRPKNHVSKTQVCSWTRKIFGPKQRRLHVSGPKPRSPDLLVPIFTPAPNLAPRPYTSSRMLMPGVQTLSKTYLGAPAIGLR